MSTAQSSLFDSSETLSGIVPLGDLTNGQEADFFALLSAKEELTTRDGKPYFRVTFRDAKRDVSFPIWNDTSWSTVCRDQWTVGEFFKLRALYRETNYGPQLEIRKIRPVVDADAKEGELKPESASVGRVEIPSVVPPLELVLRVACVIARQRERCGWSTWRTRKRLPGHAS